MAHLTDGTLRRLVDEPAGVTDADREHVAGCRQCLADLAAVQQDAAVAAAALTVDTSTDVDEGWRRLSGALAADDHPREATVGAVPRWRAVLRRPAVAAFAAAAVLGGPTAAAAAGWLPIFRTEQIAPVAVTEADLVALPDLTAYGDVEVVAEPDVRTVANAAAAQDVTGLTVPEVAELPRGVAGDPVVQVGDEMTAVFTFSAEQAAQAAAAAGETLPPPPPGMDGSDFRLVAGPGVAQVWSSSHGAPALVVGRAVAPTGYSSGVEFETARDYLLSLPGMPDDVASQLRTFSGDGTTLPLPVPADLVADSAADVDGNPATVLTSRDGTLTGVVWVEDGVVTAVAGSLSTDEVLSVARGLQ